MKFLFISLLLIPAVALSQTRAFDCQGNKPVSEGEVGELVSQVQSAYSKVPSLSGSFFQESFNAALELSETATGRFAFKKPGKMKWDYESPEKQVFLVQENTVWLYQEEQRQVLIDKFDRMMMSDLPVGFLMGIGDLKNDFDVRAACTTPDGTVLELAPKSKKSRELSSFKLLVGTGSYIPAGASVQDISGNTTSFILSDVRSDPEFDDEIFEPSFPKGLDVQDRRFQKKRGE